jgi:hypothetical protein
MQGLTGARTALLTGAGEQYSSERDRQARRYGHKTLLSLVHRAAEGPTELRLRQEALR